MNQNGNKQTTKARYYLKRVPKPMPQAKHTATPSLVSFQHVNMIASSPNQLRTTQATLSEESERLNNQTINNNQRPDLLCQAINTVPTQAPFKQQDTVTRQEFEELFCMVAILQEEIRQLRIDQVKQIKFLPAQPGTKPSGKSQPPTKFADADNIRQVMQKLHPVQNIPSTEAWSRPFEDAKQQEKSRSSPSTSPVKKVKSPVDSDNSTTPPPPTTQKVHKMIKFKKGKQFNDPKKDYNPSQ